MKKKILLIIMMVLAINTVKAYDFTAYAPSGQMLFCSILDQNNHQIGLTVGVPKPSGDLVIPETIHSGGADWTVTEIMDEAFRESTITSVVIPNTVTAIGNRAFYMCTQLSGTLVIPNSVNTVGYTAFCRCDRMTKVVLPEKDVIYGNGCFMTTGLTGTLVLPEGLTVVAPQMFRNNGKLTNIVIPNTVTTLSGDAFSYCDKLESVQIPESVTTIEGNPFNNCEKIETVAVEEGNLVYFSENNCVINQLTNTVVIGCKNSVIPEGVVAIGSFAFGQCGLTHMPDIPSSVTSIGDHAFLSCNDPGSLVIPETVTDIAPEAFIYSRFSMVTLPQSMDTIPYRLFGMCQWMGEVTIPESVNYIDRLAFSWCTKLKKIYVYNPIPPTVNAEQAYYHSFDLVPRSATIYVPQGSLSAYQNAPGWSEFANIVEMGIFPIGTEWYYEIENANGSITYQHLEYTADTTVNEEPVHILVRINTLYDKNLHEEKSYEYIYERDNKVYWWNKALGEFTMLYDFAAQVGDEWEIKVGMEQLQLQVDGEGTVDYNGQTYRTLTVSDPQDLFSGTIICGIGHETSFFPERLMTKGDDYRVEGIRCVWQYGQLIFHATETLCDEVYFNFHYDVDETTADGFQVYPNPTTGLITISDTQPGEYRITNTMGQTLMTGHFGGENQQIDVSQLSEGMYFITIDGKTTKLIINR
ncbi:MAG: leucine-rich repeat domain-containing protein [Bacteroidales bacterium]|nr:leucine-rich repeat domain-containing protein [Bacteroidales bacterium]